MRDHSSTWGITSAPLIERTSRIRNRFAMRPSPKTAHVLPPGVSASIFEILRESSLSVNQSVPPRTSGLNQIVVTNDATASKAAPRCLR